MFVLQNIFRKHAAKQQQLVLLMLPMCRVLRLMTMAQKPPQLVPGTAKSI